MITKVLSLVLLCFLTHTAHIFTTPHYAYAAPLYGEDMISDMLVEESFTLSDQTGVFPAMLEEYQKNKVELPWRSVEIQSSKPLSTQEDKESLAKLINYVSGDFETSITIYVSPSDVGTILSDIIQQIPDLQKTEIVLMEPGVVYCELYLSGNRIVWLNGLFFEFSILPAENQELQLKKLPARVPDVMELFDLTLRLITDVGKVYFFPNTEASDSQLLSLLREGGNVRCDAADLSDAAILNIVDEMVANYLEQVSAIPQLCEAV